VAVTVTGARDGSTGTLAEEALRLIEALGVIAGAQGGGDAHSHSGEGRSSWAEAGGAAECRACPVCRLVAAVRHLRPEVLAHLVAAGEELLAAARELAASTAPAGPPPSSSSPSSGPEPSAGFSAGSRPPARPPARRPERIELD
jgi:hypothetical protein